MEKELWQFIERSKGGKEFLLSRKQFQNLEQEIKTIKDSDLEVVYQEWEKKMDKLRKDNAEFERLHENNGGIISGGDDAFYMDFATWLLAQGEGLYKRFETVGHQAVLDYIELHNISECDYLFECMGYVFADYRHRLNYYR